MWRTPMYNTTKLTLELRDIVDNGENSVDIWNFDYPSFYTGDDKKAFEQKVIDHYYFRQIGQETVGRFVHYFRTRIREIMPYYIRMYESVKLMDDLENPFDNVDVVETFQEETTGTASGSSSETASGSSSGTSSGSSSGTASTTSTATATDTQSGETTETETSTRNDDKKSTEAKEHRFSNTPQGNISNLNDYMTEAFTDNNTFTEEVDTTISGETSSESSSTMEHESTDNTSSETTGTSTSETTGTSTSETTGTSTSETTGTVTHTLTRKGNQGVNTYAHDIMEYRQSLIDVDMMIINNLQDLFLGVY